MSEGAYRSLQKCRGCHSPSNSWRPIFEMEPMPLAGQFCRSVEEAKTADRYPLSWIECTTCGLVQVLEDVDDKLLFSQYNYASSTVPGLVRHFEGYARFLAERYGSGPIRLLEIGCNDGVLLKKLPRAWSLVGVDPSDVAGFSSDRNYDLLQVPFTEATSASVPLVGTFDVVTGSNCLAHISDLLDVFRGVRAVLREGGEFILEVHDLNATVASGQWDTIYHEHKVEWSADSLRACLAPLGFEPSFVDHLPLHGGLLRAGFKKTNSDKGRPKPQSPSFELLRNAYLGRRDTETYHAIAAALEAGQTVGAYGASGRANVWFNQLPEVRVAYIVDDSPLRSGKWLPGVGIPVTPAQKFLDQPTDICVITAWNFAQDIQRKYPSYKGRWLTSLRPPQDV